MLEFHSICLDYRHFFNLFAQFKINAFGHVNTPEALEKLVKLIDDFKDKNKGLFAKIKQLDDGNFVAAVVDPLARRVHKVKIWHLTFLYLIKTFWVGPTIFKNIQKKYILMTNYHFMQNGYDPALLVVVSRLGFVRPHVRPRLYWLRPSICISHGCQHMCFIVVEVVDPAW